MQKSLHEVAHLFFSKEGILASSLQGFEERQGQLDMALQIFDAYQQNSIALVEAGTGIGKSLAYALPAITWAIKKKETTVISTHTIALQEQLFLKDIPFLLKIMEADVKVVLVKGMSNYLCLKKWEDEVQQNVSFQDSLEGKRLTVWQESTSDGSRSSIPFEVSSSSWEKVSADNDTCIHVHCPHYKRCHFFKARRQVEDAHILIVNHHLLLADVVSQVTKQQNTLLPAYTRLIVDEAHHLRSIAFEMLSTKIHRIECFALLHKVSSENAHSIVSRILQKVIAENKENPTLVDFMQKDIPTQKKDAILALHELFLAIEPLMNMESKMRCSDEFLGLYPHLTPLFQNAITQLKSFGTQVFLLLRNLELLKKESEKMNSLAQELQAACAKVEEKVAALEGFSSFQKGYVRWIERQGSEQSGNLTLIQASLDIAPVLRKHIFDNTDSVTLCSATLTSGQDFSFLKDSLGLAKIDREVSEKIYHSPFDYANNSVLAVPSDISDPSSPFFLKEAIDWIKSALTITEGKAFILFTSYDMLQQCYEQLKDFAKKERLTLLKQGDTSRQILIEKFQNSDCPVLLGTDSFWEGVDIAGDQLQLVVIMKLPFQVPTEPLVQAHVERLQQEGKDPFSHYSVPHAAMKFKQGFGRLIRRKTDKGAVVCLDKRLMTKAYGKIFLKTLPPAKVIFDKGTAVLSKLKEFYGA